MGLGNKRVTAILSRGNQSNDPKKISRCPGY